MKEKKVGKKPHGMVLIVSVGKPRDKDAKDMFKKPEKKVEKAALPGSERQVPLVGAVPATRGMWAQQQQQMGPDEEGAPPYTPISVDEMNRIQAEKEMAQTGHQAFRRRNTDPANIFPGRRRYTFKRTQGGYTGTPKLAGELEPIDIAMLLLKQSVGLL